MRVKYFMKLSVMVLLIVFAFCSTVWATDYYVDVTNGNDDNNGLTWGTAKATIGGAMSLADGDDIIHVAAGSYNEKVSFPVANNVQLLGGYPAGGGEQDPWNNPTIIDGTGLASGPMISIPALNAEGGTGLSGIVIDGFTIRNGINTGFGTAGIESYSLGVTISRNIIESNNATGTYGLAGGIYIFGGLNDSGSPLIKENIIQNNSAAGIGGIYLEGASGRLSNYWADLINNLIIGNASTDTGTFNWGTGGVDVMYPASAYIVNCTIADNTAAHPEVPAAGIHVNGFSSTEAGIVDVLNSIIWHPGGDDIFVTGNGFFYMSYSDVEDAGDAVGTGTISQDPLFAGTGDYHLSTGSPCIDTALLDGAPSIDLEGTARPQGEGIDMGAYEYFALVAVGPTIESLDMFLSYMPNIWPCPGAITISDSDPPTITAASDIRLTIPDSLGTIWSVSGTGTLDVTGDAAGKINTNLASLTLENGGRTLVIDVTSDFAAGDDLIIDHICHVETSETTPSGASGHLELSVDGDSIPEASDPFTWTVAVLGASSAANQFFQVGDPPTEMSPLTVTEDATNTTMKAFGTISLEIPSGLNMTWDDTIPTATITGSASAKVSSNVSYNTAADTATLSILEDFNLGESVTISGLKFTSFSDISSPASIRVRTNWFAMAADNKTKEIAAAPPVQYDLAVSIIGSGSVLLDPPGGIYNAGSYVECDAIPDPGWFFSRWTGDISGAFNPAFFLMNSEKDITANFIPLSSERDSISIELLPGDQTQDYRILALPLVPDATNPVDLLGPQIGTYDTTMMRIFHWEAWDDPQEFSEYTEFDQDGYVKPGEAAWFLFRNGKTLTFEGTETPTTIGPNEQQGYYLAINEGWNQIGNPYNFPIDVDAITVIDNTTGNQELLTATTPTITQGVFWIWVNGSYQPAVTLQPGEGGWVKKLTPGHGDLFYPAVASERSAERTVRAASVEGLEQPPAPPALPRDSSTESSDDGGGSGGGCFIQSAGGSIGPSLSRFGLLFSLLLLTAAKWRSR